jgi:hypothetical protein
MNPTLPALEKTDAQARVVVRYCGGELECGSRWNPGVSDVHA